MWQLTIEDYEGLTTFHRLSGPRYVLGRAPDNDIILAQLNVSRRHCRLERQGDGWVYVDEGSGLGSYVNCVLAPPHEPIPLADGAVVQFSDYVLRFSTRALEGERTPPPRYVEPARLRALAGPLAGVEHIFGRGETVTIGSDSECTLPVVHASVSFEHAVIRPLGDGRHELVDKSYNGMLFVNGRRPECSEYVLEGGDAISVGGVALFRYLEASQQPDPRFDESWGVAVPASERPRAPARGGRASRPSSIEAPLPNRVEAVGPLPLPAPASPSASFRRLCQTTIGSVRGPVVVERSPQSAAMRASDLARRHTSPPSAPALVAPVPSPRATAAPAPPPATPSDSSRSSQPEAPEPARAPTPAVEPARQWLRSEAFWSVVVALAIVVGMKMPLPSFGHDSVTASHLSSAIASPAIPAALPAVGATPATAALMAPAAPPAPATVPEPTAESLPMTAPSAAARPAAGPRATGRRALLEARVRSGRASPSEAHELLLLCQAAADGRCIANARKLLGRVAKP